MFAFLYEWIRSIAFYMVLVTAVIQVLPNHTYKKYIRFFTGMILILLLMTPILKMFDMETFQEVFTDETYQQEMERIKEKTKYLEEVQPEDYIENAEKSGIEVEEIRIEP